MKIQRFEDIDAWKMARELTKSVYAAAKGALFSRDSGLRDQVQRAAGSIMNNIAEGFDSGSNREFIRFLRYSQRSCSEVQSELYIALDQDYISSPQFSDLYERAAATRAKIGAFVRYLRDYEVKKSTNR